MSQAPELRLLHEDDIRRLPRGRLVPIYLMAGHVYEFHDDPMMTDGAWEILCKRLDDEWLDINHPHKQCIERSEMATGTASYLTEERLPLLAKGACLVWLANPQKVLEEIRACLVVE